MYYISGLEIIATLYLPRCKLITLFLNEYFEFKDICSKNDASFKGQKAVSSF